MRFNKKYLNLLSKYAHEETAKPVRIGKGVLHLSERDSCRVSLCFIFIV